MLYNKGLFYFILFYTILNMSKYVCSKNVKDEKYFL